MQVLLQRKEFHQHMINLMSSRAVMYELAHNYYVLIKLHWHKGVNNGSVYAHLVRLFLMPALECWVHWLPTPSLCRAGLVLQNRIICCYSSSSSTSTDTHVLLYKCNVSYSTLKLYNISLHLVAIWWCEGPHWGVPSTYSGCCYSNCMYAVVDVQEQVKVVFPWVSQTIIVSILRQALYSYW